MFSFVSKHLKIFKNDMKVEGGYLGRGRGSAGGGREDKYR
jgi:hypothetical protein